MPFFPAVLLTVATAAAMPAAWASPQLATKAGRAVCHVADKPMVGPSWKDIAGRCKRQSRAAALLADRMRTVLRDRLVNLTISRTDFFSRKTSA